MSALLMGRCFELDLKVYATREASASAMQWVLIALADHAHSEGTTARPSVGYLAWKIGLHERTVQRALNRLEEVGLLIAVNGREGGRSSTDWDIQIDDAPRKPKYDPKAKIEGRHSVTPNPRHSAAPEPRRRAVAAVASVTPGVTQLRRPRGDTQVSPESVVEPSIEPGPVQSGPVLDLVTVGAKPDLTGPGGDEDGLSRLSISDGLTFREEPS